MRYAVLFLSLCMCLSACQKQQPATEQTQAARVGELSISQQDIQNALSLLDEKDRSFAATPIGRQNFLQILTRRQLILQDARNWKLDRSKEFLNRLAQKRAELDAIYQTYTQDALEQYWYEVNAKRFEPSEEEIKAYFDKYPYEMTIKQIIVDNAQTADQVLRTLKSSPGRWKEISRQYNIAPQSLQTLTFMPGEYLENLEVVAANSPTGKVQGFFKTSQGFHIIMKTDEKRLSLQQAQERIKQILENQKIDRLLDTLKTKYEVIIYDKNE